MLANGERQVAPTLDGVRRDHVARYEFARGLLGGKGLVLDLACGIGYGASMLADSGCDVVAVDRSFEALEYGRAHYGRSGVDFICADATTFAPKAFGDFDAAVCFETIEHLEDPLPLLKRMRSACGRLIASVPNEAVFPYRNYKFHYRHYTRAEFQALLTAAGWSVVSWHGQAGPESEVEPDIDGRTLVAVCEPSAVAAPEAPEHVAIVGLGPSVNGFFELTRRMGGVSAYCDEVWGINALGDVLRCDRVFHMDDVLIQEERAALNPAGNIAAMVNWLKTHPGPVYTSVPRPGYPGMVPFPLQDVLNARYDGAGGGVPYFNSTAAYAIAFAVHLGVKKISLFGLDYTLENMHRAEQGRACCEFWLGIAAARGIVLAVYAGSTLLDACADDRERLYGYDCVDVRLEDQGDGSVRVAFSERAGRPTGADIEARYDHSKHPNRLMRETP